MRVLRRLLLHIYLVSSTLLSDSADQSPSLTLPEGIYYTLTIVTVYITYLSSFLPSIMKTIFKTISKHEVDYNNHDAIDPFTL